MSRQVVLTGLRANNDLHIGNYFGALAPIVDMSKKHAAEYQINLFVPDLHSFTTPVEHGDLYQQTLYHLKLFAAAGLPLDEPNIHIYRQSYIPAHSELTWILNCFTGMGEMSRMTQFKDKSSQLNEDRISVGLFDYPVLMAADILLYGAEYVPVGDDQTQHLEFTRDIAERMNKQFGDLFVVPKPVIKQHEFFGKQQGLRIRDLNDPSKKMSKSANSAKGIIFMSDSPESAAKKILSAETDSLQNVTYDYEKQPGISNLLDLLKLLGGKPDNFIGQKQYGPLKEAVARELQDFLVKFQKSVKHVDEEKLNKKLTASETKMREQAEATLAKVQKAVGLRP